MKIKVRNLILSQRLFCTWDTFKRLFAHPGSKLGSLAAQCILPYPLSTAIFLPFGYRLLTCTRLPPSPTGLPANFPLWRTGIWATLREAFVFQVCTELWNPALQEWLTKDMGLHPKITFHWWISSFCHQRVGSMWVIFKFLPTSLPHPQFWRIPCPQEQDFREG